MVTPSASFSAALVVEDFPSLESDDKMEMPLVKHREVFDLAQCGARAFRERRFDEAISFYSKAHNLRSGDPIILSNRSSAFCLISQVLRERSAADSEYQPLNGLDPTTHAELALKDAEKVVTTHGNSPRPYLLKAYALILLERYQEARESLLAGLQVDPLSHILQTCLSDLDRNTNAAAGARCPRLDRTDDFECTLCFKLLFEPVTTPCGHTFCRSCLHQSMDHGNKCPMCRTVLFIGPRTYPISVTLSNIIQKNFPEEYAERRSEHENMTYAGIDLMPLFVMDVVLPCQKMALNIFEPRYRLMVRRIMEGSHRMGMVAIDSATGTVADCGCEVEILECEPLPDGRFYLEVEGSRRFRILRSWDEDGYRVAEIEWFQDVSLPEGSQERRDLIERANEASELARTYIRRTRETIRPVGRARHFDLESIPGPRDPEKFSFWLVNLINLRPSDKLELLRLCDTRERISLSLRLLGNAEQGCRVQ
ncbi:LON peptidase N-terminal domain and RING finger protein 1-like [Triticum dicoccoides]|uniref:LON peptidase N-terminal domain and RING finger protein 1-like n=1 Tax=Triticum dicoccoides TaxID=85692 RepID=UPI00188F6178|nr:LON peptidase N-terminal domain and RING finger protein 1-like [Triticum dicoccoides]